MFATDTEGDCALYAIGYVPLSGRHTGKIRFANIFICIKFGNKMHAHL